MTTKKSFQIAVPVLFLTALAIALLPTRVVEAQTGVAVISCAADITGDAAAHQLVASGSARWIQFIAPAANGAVVRIGDSTTSVSRGLPVAAGGGLMLPALPVETRLSLQDHFYSLAGIYYYAGSGDKLSYCYAK